MTPFVQVAVPASQADPVQFGSLFETLVRGGPVMIPLAVCSVLALTWMMERLLRMRGGTLGNRAQAERLIAAAREGGPARALELARSKPTVLSNIFKPVFERWAEDRSALEKAVEDSGAREMRTLISSLRPLTVITVSAPLLGLLGTVIGIIIAFRDIALSNAMGKPEALATGIAQALVTTATGLAIAIPTQASYYWFRSRIDRFWHLVEDTGEQIFAVHGGQPARTPSSPPVSTPPSPVESGLGQAAFTAQAGMAQAAS
jgi:biopolymer transport protein ExbB